MRKPLLLLLLLLVAYVSWAQVTTNSPVTGVAGALNLTGPITSTGNATAVAAQTGTGSTFVMSVSPAISNYITISSTGLGSAATPWIGSDTFGGVAVNAPTGKNVLVAVNNAAVATFTATGLNTANIGATTPGTGAFTTTNTTTSYSVNGTLLYSASAPTISSGFGGSPTVASNNGSATFRVNIGTGGVSASGIVALPTAANGWNCSVQEFAPSAAALLSVTVVNASTTSTVSVVNDLLSTGAPTAWQASQILIFNCSAY